jgi:hypothetical protein
LALLEFLVLAVHQAQAESQVLQVLLALAAQAEYLVQVDLAELLVTAVLAGHLEQAVHQERQALVGQVALAARRE